MTVKDGIKTLLSMMTVLRYAPGVDEGTLSTYNWVLSKKGITVSEIEQVTLYVMTNKSEWQAPADLVAILKRVRNDAYVAEINNTKSLPYNGGVCDKFDDVRAGIIGKHAAILKEELGAKSKARQG